MYTAKTENSKQIFPEKELRNSFSTKEYEYVNGIFFAV
jgi:hypothetical protein